MNQQTAQAETDHQPSREERFVAGIMAWCEKDRGLAARLRRADNPDTEYQSWEVLARFGVRLDRDSHRLPHALISAAIAKGDYESDGQAGLGHALAGCYEDGRESNQAKAKLRRLLACGSVAEVCRVLRPMLSLINSKSNRRLNHARLLSQLNRFQFQPQRVKVGWAQDFYGRPAREAETGGDR